LRKLVGEPFEAIRYVPATSDTVLVGHVTGLVVRATIMAMKEFFSLKVRVGWVSAIILGIWFGASIPSCGMDNKPELVSKFTYVVQAGSVTPYWSYQCFMTMQGASDWLNQLSVDRALEAKAVSLDQKYAYGTPYCFYYRK
jgi:hypothetical protein